jgi:hypothetical protein
MSAPVEILRDEFGLPVKSSSVTVIVRDASGFPVRSLQRTGSLQQQQQAGGGVGPAAARPVSVPVPAASRPGTEAGTGTGRPPTGPARAASARDAAGFPIKGVAAVEMAPRAAETAPRAPLERTASAPTPGRGSSNPILHFMKGRKQYASVGRDEPAPAAVAAAAAVAVAGPQSTPDIRRERSADLSLVLSRVDSHLAAHGLGQAAVCVDEADEYAVGKFFSRNQGTLRLPYAVSLCLNCPIAAYDIC